MDLRQTQPPGLPVVFRDQFDRIQPTSSQRADYTTTTTTISWLRMFGATRLPALPQASAPKSMIWRATSPSGAEVSPEFKDHLFEDDASRVRARDRPLPEHQRPQHLKSMKVGRDATNVFCLRANRQRLSPSTDTNWMWLLIDADANLSTGWNGYDFIVNRSIDGRRAGWRRISEAGIGAGSPKSRSGSRTVSLC